MEGVGGVYGVINTSFAWAILALACLLVFYVLGLGWKSFTCSCKTVKKRSTTQVTHFCSEVSEWISNTRVRCRLRRENEIKLKKEKKEKEENDFMRKGAYMVNKDDDKDGSKDLSISTPWIHGVQQPKPIMIPVRTKYNLG